MDKNPDWLEEITNADRKISDMEELLNALASDRLVCLTNYGAFWEIEFKASVEPHVHVRMSDKAFDDLLFRWLRILRASPDEAQEEVGRV